MKIIIGADIVATEKNEKYFVSGNVEKIVGRELKTLLESSDFNIFNLEAPLINEECPIKKAGVCLKMSEEVLKGLQQLNISLLTLANNHIMDQGTKGYNKTVELLKNANIPYVGVGNNVFEASKGYIYEKQNVRIGIYACAEHEFSIATENSPGANPYDPLNSFDHINELKKNCDFLIVLFHGGKEYYRYPSPEIQKVFRKMAEKGADVVISQHTHCVGCYEKYCNSLLLYGQGNFIFDRGNDEYWNSGLLLEINYENNSVSYNFVPIEKNHDGTISLSSNCCILNQFHDRSTKIKSKDFVQKEYKKIVNENFEYYLRIVNGNNLIFRILNKIVGGKLIFKLYSKKGELGLLNFIMCEAHRELLINGLKDRNITKYESERSL